MSRVWILSDDNDLDNLVSHVKDPSNGLESHIVISMLKLEQSQCEFLHDHNVNAIYHAITQEDVSVLLKVLEKRGIKIRSDEGD